MNRTISLIALALAAAALSACGGSSSNQAKSGGGSPTDTVSLASVSGVGKVLVNSKGFALYSPVQEKAGTIRCTGSCTATWVPLTTKGTPSGPASLQLGTVMRPDGRTQVTFKGKPLYVFAQDSSPKSVTGNGVSDNFGGKAFTWHVASTGTSGGSGGGGYSSRYGY
jgi:predicted lipoprotein with Yx(FWY)xxD motif